jgi:RNA polymerase sigma-70 factor (ECF subfamily)
MEKDFIDLLNKHRGIIYKICNLYCNEQGYKKDLFQEIVLQLWKAFPSFREEAQITTWMYRIALNTAISNFRKESKKPQQHPVSLQDFQIPDTSYLADKNDNLTMLMQAINHLSKVKKAIILLYLDEKSYEDIAAIIGISKTNVGVRINRIKTKLETLINS